MKREFFTYFPKNSCYPNQAEAMDEIYEALIKSNIVLFEGACGTGKTLSALVPALYFAKKTKKTVVIATNVHQQMLQFIEEAREIRKKNDIKVIVLKGKMIMCPKPDMDYDTCNILKENSYKLVELENKLADIREQLIYTKEQIKIDKSLTKDYKNLSKSADEIKRKIHELSKRSCDKILKIINSEFYDFNSWLFSDVRTPEQVSELAYKHNTCGYELLKKSMKHADLLICNYHHFLDEDIRENVLKWLDKSLEEIILIFDEAHNIESAARSHSSIIIEDKTIDQAINEMLETKLDEKDVIAFLKTFLNMMKNTYKLRLKFGELAKIGDNWHDIKISDPYERKDMFKNKLLSELKKQKITKIDKIINKMEKIGLKIEKRYEKQFNDGYLQFKKSSALLVTASFLSDYMKYSEDMSHYPILSVKRIDRKVSTRLELFTCIPKKVTSELFKSVHSAVLMSATLKPFDTVKEILGIKRETQNISFPLTFPQKNRMTLTVSTPPLFSRDRNKKNIIKTVTKVLNDIIKYSKGNVLIFFPSYHDANEYKSRINSNYLIFLDEVGVSSQDVRNEFFKIGESGKKAVLLSYMWGTLTEGVDYKDSRARTVVIVGVGYPSLNDRMLAIEAAYNSEYGRDKGWDYAIQIPTIRKVRQALGRVIRSPQDYGMRILLDMRYSPSSVKTLKKYSVYNVFPEEERKEMIEIKPEKVKDSIISFFNSTTDLSY